MKSFKSVLIAITVSSSMFAAYAAKNPYSYQPFLAENNTYKGQISPKTYKPKNTYVKPYVHKDGSRVRSYYRSNKK